MGDAVMPRIRGRPEAIVGWKKEFMILADISAQVQQDCQKERQFLISFDVLCIGMALLCVMDFVKDEQIDLIHANETMGQAMMQDIGSANHNHVFHKHFLPRAGRPEVTAHGTTEFLSFVA